MTGGMTRRIMDFYKNDDARFVDIMRRVYYVYYCIGLITLANWRFFQIV